LDQLGVRKGKQLEGLFIYLFFILVWTSTLGAKALLHACLLSCECNIFCQYCFISWTILECRSFVYLKRSLYFVEGMAYIYFMLLCVENLWTSCNFPGGNEIRREAVTWIILIRLRFFIPMALLTLLDRTGGCLYNLSMMTMIQFHHGC
jgi:hypothetical protein